MSSELVASLGPNDFIRESSLGNDTSVQVINPYGTAGDLRGISLPKLTNPNIAVKGYIASFRIPANITMGTGLTFKIYLSDDGVFAADLGLKVEVGVTVKRLAADETTDIDMAAGTEQLVAVTLSSTAGGVAIGSLAIASANLDSAAVGDLVMIRVRRKGTDTTNDTAQGRAILWRIEVQNT